MIIHHCRREFSLRKSSRGLYSLSSTSNFSWGSYPAVPLACRIYKHHKDSQSELIMVHGLLGCGQNWMSYARKITNIGESGFDVLLPDLRNHGNSPHRNYGPTTYYDLASDLRRLILERTRSEKVTLLGHSIGGKTAMLLALLEPQLVNRLIVVDASPIHRTTQNGIENMKSILGALESANLISARTLQEARTIVNSKLQRVIASKTIRNWLLTNIAEKSNCLYTWKFNVESFRRDFEKHLTQMPLQDVYDKTFTKPTIFIGAEKSGYIPKDGHEDIRKFFPNSKFVYIRRTGHWIQFYNPVDFMKELVRFIYDENEMK